MHAHDPLPTYAKALALRRESTYRVNEFASTRRCLDIPESDCPVVAARDRMAPVRCHRNVRNSIGMAFEGVDQRVRVPTNLLHLRTATIG